MENRYYLSCVEFGDMVKGHTALVHVKCGCDLGHSM